MAKFTLKVLGVLSLSAFATFDRRGDILSLVGGSGIVGLLRDEVRRSQGAQTFLFIGVAKTLVFPAVSRTKLLATALRRCGDRKLLLLNLPRFKRLPQIDEIVDFYCFNIEICIIIILKFDSASFPGSIFILFD